MTTTLLDFSQRRELALHARVAAIIAEQADAERPGLLPQEMYPLDAERARALLRGILEGLYEG